MIILHSNGTRALTFENCSSGLEGACFTSVTPQSVVSMQGAGAPRFDHSQATALAPSNVSGVVHSRASWDAVKEQLSFFVAGDGLVAKQEYTVSFDVRNPASAQSSPFVSIEATGIPIIESEMQKNPNKILPPSIFGALVSESEPLEVRGLSVSSSFILKKIGQSNVNPGESNTLTITLKLNLPLTSSAPVSSISVSGLRGAIAPSGPIPLTVTTTANSGSFSAKWHDGEKRLSLTVLTATIPGANYVIAFTVTNARLPQTSPSILIESSGIVIQPITMDADVVGKLTTKNDLGVVVPTVEGATAPLFIISPRFIKRYVHQTGGSAWPAQSNTITVLFTPTVSLKPVSGGKVTIIVSGLKGVDVPSGPVLITGDSADKFTDCAKLNISTCTRRRGIWNAATQKLSLNVFSSIAAFDDVSLKFNFTNSIVGQDGIHIHKHTRTHTHAHAHTHTIIVNLNWI